MRLRNAWARLLANFGFLIPNRRRRRAAESRRRSPVRRHGLVQRLEERVVMTAQALDDGPVSTPYATTVEISALANDSGTGTLTPSDYNNAGHGSVSFDSGTGKFSYTPDSGFWGRDSFTYDLTDEDPSTAYDDTVTIDVSVDPDWLEAHGDTFETNEDVDGWPSLTENDDLPTNNNQTLELVSGPSHGTLDGWHYTPEANYSGTDSFSYRIYNGSYSSTAGVSITINPVNDAPTPEPDEREVAEDESIDISGSDLVGNDGDVEGDAIAFDGIESGPSHGTLTNHYDGTYTYVPNADYNGSDSFVYRVKDSHDAVSYGTVSITITPVNDSPTGSNAEARTHVDEAFHFSASDLLAWSAPSDVDGDSVTIGDVSGATWNGSSYSFTGATSGDAEITFTLVDGNGGSTPRTLTMHVLPAVAPQDDAPVVDEDGQLTGNVLANDSPEGLTVTPGSGPAHGQLQLNSDGSFTYTPDANFFGSDSFSYTAHDAYNGSATATVMITVNSVNDDPSGSNAEAWTHVGETFNFSATDLLAWSAPSDVEGDSVTIGDVSGATWNGGGYSFSSSTPGDAEITLTLVDGNGGSTSRSLTMHVLPAVAPQDDAPAVDEDGQLTGNVLANDSPAGLTVTPGDGPTHGQLQLNSDGSYTYTPAANFSGSDSFSYTAHDAHDGSATATVTITVNPVNDTPTGSAESYGPNEDALLEVDAASGVLANDTDPDNDALAAQIVSGPNSAESFTLHADGSFSYRPQADFFGLDSFTYVVSDGTSTSGPITVTIDVASVNDAPTFTAGSDVGDLQEDDPSYSAPWASNMSFGPANEYGQGLSFEVTNDNNGLFSVQPSIEGNGTLSFSLAPNANGSADVTVRLHDSGGTANGGVDVSEAAHFTISVAAVDDAPTGVASQDSTIVEDTSYTTPAVSDIENDALTIVVIPGSGPAHGTIHDNGDGTLTYTPGANRTDPVTFQYKVVDAGGAESDVATVNQTITPVNDPPVPTPDSYSPDEDTELNVAAAAGVLANDVEVDGDTLSAVLVDGPTNAQSFTLNADGSFSYLPNPDFYGEDSFTYKVSDGQLESEPVTVSIHVAAVNDAPRQVLPSNVLVAAGGERVFSTAGGNAVQVVDDATGAIQVMLTVEHGTLSLSQTTGLTFLTGDGADDWFVSFSGTVAAINGALDGLKFKPTAGYYGTANLTMATQDLGGTGSGGALADFDVLSMQVVPTISIAGVTVNETAGTATFTVTLSHTYSQAITVAYATEDGSATAGEDFVARSGILTIPAGLTSGAINITLGDDNLYEENESFVLRLSQPGNGVFAGYVDSITATATIISDDVPVLSVSGATLDEAAEYGEFQLDLTAAMTSDTTVYWSFDQDVSTAKLGSDFDFVYQDGLGFWQVLPVTPGVANAITFAAGETQKTIRFRPNDDLMFENDESIRVTVSADAPITVSPTAGAATSTLENDDTAPPVRILNTSVTEEDDGTTTFSMQLEIDPTELAAQVNWQTVAGSATAETDFVAGSGTVTFGDGSDPENDFVRTITLSIRNDLVSEFAEQFTIQLSGAVNAVLTSGHTAGTVTILDNDPFNQAPTISAPSAPSTDTNEPLVFSAAGGNPITIADPDSGDADVRLTLSVSGGTLSAAGSAGVLASGDGSTASPWVWEGTVAELNAALDGLTYTPVTESTDAVTLSLLVDDLGNTGGGGNQTASASRTITIVTVNDAPVNTVPVGQSMPEGGTLVFSSDNGNQISVGDVDAGPNPVRVTLTGTNGVISLAGTSGLTFTVGNGTANAVMTFTGTIEDVNAALNGLSFVPSSEEFSGLARLQIVTNDLGNSGSGGALSDTHTVDITVEAVNDAPSAVIALESYGVDAGATLTLHGTGLSVGDIDAGDSTIQVTISAASGTLAATAGTTGVTVGGSGSQIVTLGGTLMQINNLLAGNLAGALTYSIDSGTAPESDTLTLSVSDLGSTGAGGPLTASDTAEIDITHVNRAPTISAPSAPSTSEDTPLIFSGVGNSILIDDVDAGDGQLQLTFSVSAGTLTAPYLGGISASGAGTTAGPFVWTGTLTGLNAALSGLTFTPVAESSDPVTLSIQVDDLGNSGSGGNRTAQLDRTITIQAVNDAPTGANFDLMADQGLSRSITVAEILTRSSAADVDGQVVDAVIAPRQTATGGMVRLEEGSYVYTGYTPGTDTFQVVLRDDGGAETTVTMTVYIGSNPAAPTAGDDTFSTDEDLPLTISPDDLLANDTHPYQAPLSIVVVQDPLHGDLSYQMNGSTIAAVIYTPDANYNGPDSFKYVATDGTNSSNLATVDLTVVAVNDPPSFTIGGDVTMAADETLQGVAGWLSGGSPGPADEAGQHVTYTISFVHQEDRALFEGAPLVGADGGLYFIPAGTAGTAEMLITAHDDGGGPNASTTQAFTITLTAPVGGEDPPPSGSFYVEDAEADEDDGVIRFTVGVDDPDAGPIALFWTTQPDDADQNDFAMDSGWLLFLPGDAPEQVVSIQVNDDDVDEDDRQYFTLLVSSEDESQEAVGAIVDNDDSPTVSVTLEEDAIDPNEGGELTFKITVDGKTEREVTVDYATEDGSAKAYDDYNGTGGTFVFAPNPTGEVREEEVRVGLRDDHKMEGDEDFTLKVVAVRNAQLDAAGPATGVIRDYTPQAHIEAIDSGAEEGSPIRFKAVLDRWSTSATTVHYVTIDDTADGGDYDTSGGTVDIPAGQLEVEFSIGTYDDETEEGTETFKVGVANDDPANAALVSIYDNDPPPDDPDPDCGDEYDVIDNTCDEFVEVRDPNWVDPTPDVPDDNEAPIIGWDHYQTIDITFDYKCEDREDVHWVGDRLFIDFHAKADGDPPTADSEGFAWIESIQSDDEDGVIDEDDGTISFTVQVGTHGNPSTFPTLKYETRDGTATAGQDYVGENKTVQLSAGDNPISIQITDDDRPEGSESFSVKFGDAPKSGLGVNSDAGYLVTIRDDDGFSVSSSRSDLAADDNDDDNGGGGDGVTDNLETPTLADVGGVEYSTLTLGYDFSTTSSDVTGYRLSVTHANTVSLWENVAGTLTRIASGYYWTLGPGSDVPTTLYVRGEQGGPASVDFNLSGTAQKPYDASHSASFFVYQADLDVYSAGYATEDAEHSGSDPISEETTGACGFVNDDDTDADGQVDSSDDDVRPTAPDEGRLEQDLVKLVINRPALPTASPENLNDQSKWLTLSLAAGAANLWAQPWKGTPVTLNAGGTLLINPWTISATGLVIWAELLDGAVPAMFTLQIGPQKDAAKVAALDKPTFDAQTVQDDVNDETNFNKQDAYLKEAGGDQTIYLPFNDDDDDYDGVLDGATTLTTSSPPPLVDNDLLRIVFRNVGSLPAGGYFTIEAPDTIRKWKKSATAYVPLTQADLTLNGQQSIEFWIDAKATGAIASGKLKATYHLKNGDTGLAAGEFNIKTFKINGPRYVPNNAQYEYTARGGAEDSMSGFIAARHGSTQVTAGTNGVDKLDKAEVLWSDGAKFGKLRYQASPNYRWAFDVAIVDVTLDLDEGSGLFYADQTKNGPVQVVQNGDVFARVDSTAGRSGIYADVKMSDPIPDTDRNKPAMQAFVTISSIIGPTRMVGTAEKMYGVNKIEVGLGQTFTFTAFNAVYGTALPPVPVLINSDKTEDNPRPSLRNIPLQGLTFIDQITKVALPGSTYNHPLMTNVSNPIPYYDKDNYTAWYGTDTERVSILRPSKDDPVYDTVLSVADTPSFNGTNDIAVGTDPLTRLNIIFSFQIFVLARSKESDRYAKLAMADWRFNGSGKVTGGTTTKVGTWKLDDEIDAVSGDPYFQVLPTDGQFLTTNDSAPLTMRTPANRVLP